MQYQIKNQAVIAGNWQAYAKVYMKAKMVKNILVKILGILSNSKKLFIRSSCNFFKENNGAQGRLYWETVS